VVQRRPGDTLRRPRSARVRDRAGDGAFRFVASTFSDVEIFHWETLASGVAGDFAYTAAVERYTNSRNGGPPEQTELRATHVYRREDGQWRAVHRHADRRPPGP
jgi:ketosteroid isomerase-like protein